MRRPTVAFSTALAAIGLTAQIAPAQQQPRAPLPGASSSADPVDPMMASKATRYLIRNGMDYLAYREYARALSFFRAAEVRQAELSDAERDSLKKGIARAQQGMREAVNTARVVEPAKGRPGVQPGAFALAKPSAPEPVRLANVELPEPPALPPASAAPASPAPAAPGREIQLPSLPPPLPAAAPAPAPPPLPIADEPAPAVAPAAPEPARPEVVPTSLSAPATAPPPIGLELPEGPAPAPAPAPVELPPTASAAAPAEPTPIPPPTLPPVNASARPADATSAPELPPLVPVVPMPAEPAPATATPPMPAIPPIPAEPAPPVVEAPPRLAAASPREEGPPPFAPSPAPVASPAPEPPPAPEAPPRLAGDVPPMAAPAPVVLPEGAPEPILPPRLRREVEQIAQRPIGGDRPGTGAAAATDPNAPTTPPQGSTRLEISRAPSPTEARPIRRIPVPEEFVPLEARAWNPNRKYWAAAGTCHMTLYFQDPVLERYGQSVEQALGPAGRYFSYPLDDPRQSNQRNQILQPFYSIGKFCFQVGTFPYKVLMDPPSEAEYDLGYYRPGDRIPPDTIMITPTGVGPPLRGSRY